MCLDQGLAANSLWAGSGLRSHFKRAAGLGGFSSITVRVAGFAHTVAGQLPGQKCRPTLEPSCIVSAYCLLPMANTALDDSNANYNRE